MTAPVLAIDLGGTKTLAALVSGAEVLEVRRTPTQRGESADPWIEAIAMLAGDWVGRYAAAGVAVTGGIRNGLWRALNPDTLPVPENFPLVERFKARLGVPVLACNDAQAAAWGEYRYGAGQSADMVYLTISTGVGGGVVLGGRLVTGRGGLAGHIGVSSLGAPSGQRRLEDFASGSALARLAAARGHAIEPTEIFAAAGAGEAWAADLIARCAEPMIDALRSLQLILDPDVFVIGGGMGLAPLYLEHLRTALDEVPETLRPQLRAAALGANAGLVGVADLVETETALM
jgi:predicted NBD/HSP70 family sugar kinase